MAGPDDATKASSGDKTTPTDAYDLRLDQELHVARNLRVTMESLLSVFEGVRDDLVVLGDRMEKARVASERCRKQLVKRHQSDDSPDQSTPAKASGKRKREGESMRLIGKTRKTP